MYAGLDAPLDRAEPITAPVKPSVKGKEKAAEAPQVAVTRKAAIVNVDLTGSSDEEDSGQCDSKVPTRPREVDAFALQIDRKSTTSTEKMGLTIRVRALARAGYLLRHQVLLCSWVASFPQCHERLTRLSPV